MSNKLISIFLIALFYALPLLAMADVWFPSGSPTRLSPVVSTWGLHTPGVGGAGCLAIDSSGFVYSFATSSPTGCGGGSGGVGTSTNPFMASYFVATSTTATSTAANGWSLTGGCFSLNGVCVGAAAPPANGIQYNNGNNTFGATSTFKFATTSLTNVLQLSDPYNRGPLIGSAPDTSLEADVNGSGWQTIFNLQGYDGGSSFVANLQIEQGSNTWNVTETDLTSAVQLQLGNAYTSNFINDGANFGIATTAPGSLFSINNIANFTAATSSFYGNGLNIKKGCYAINATCIGGVTDMFTHPFTGYSATTSVMMIGTSTPIFSQLTVGTSTVPQLALSDNNPADNSWTIRSIANTFYLATSTATATSSSPSFQVGATGQVSLGGQVAIPVGTTPQSGYALTIGVPLTGAIYTGNAGNQLNMQGGSAVLNSTNGSIFFQTGFSGKLFQLRSSGNTMVDTWNWDTGSEGISTTTNIFWPLTIATGTVPQTALSDGNAADNLWTFRSIANSLYFATTSARTDGTYATSTKAALWIDSNAQIYFGAINNCNGVSNALGLTNNQITCDSLASDARLKKDILPIQNGLDTLMKLQPITFFWKDTKNHNTQSPLMQYGFTAQSVQPILPSAVGSTTDGYLTLDKTAIIAPMVNAIQEIAQNITNIMTHQFVQDAEIKQLQQEVQTLKVAQTMCVYQ